MQITANIQFIYDYEKDSEGVWHYTRTSKKIGTLYFNGKPFEELRGVLTDSTEKPGDDYEYVGQIRYDDGREYSLYALWAVPETDRSEKAWKEFVEEGKPRFVPARPEDIKPF